MGSQIRKGYFSALERLIRLFDFAVLANEVEAGGQQKPRRCTFPIEGEPDQPTCDLPLRTRDKCLCDVHANMAFFASAGFNPRKIYDGSPEEGRIRRVYQSFRAPRGRAAEPVAP